MTEDPVDQLRREAESALRSLSVACGRAKQGDMRALEEGTLALTRARKALQAMNGQGDAWVYGKLNAETSRLAAELERVALVMRKPDALSTQQTENDARTRIKQSNQVLEQSNVYVRDTARLMEESHAVGVNTLATMDAQRQELLQVRGDIRETDGALVSSRAILTQMAKKALVNKIFLWGVILMLILVNVLFVYYGFIKK